MKNTSFLERCDTFKKGCEKKQDCSKKLYSSIAKLQIFLEKQNEPAYLNF
jgi:hypothetical protein